MESPEKKEANFWPYAIVGMILTVVMLGAWTIKVALKNPVQLENSYMMKYQDVDEKINEILEKQRLFDMKYSMALDSNRLKLGKNRVEVKLFDKNGMPVSGAKIKVLLTRPDTAQYDIELDEFTYSDGRYLSREFTLEKRGRWNIVAKVELGGDEGFKKYRTFVE